MALLLSVKNAKHFVPVYKHCMPEGVKQYDTVKGSSAHLLFSFSAASQASRRVLLARSSTMYRSWPPRLRTITQAFCLFRTHNSNSLSRVEVFLSILPVSRSISARILFRVARDSCTPELPRMSKLVSHETPLLATQKIPTAEVDRKWSEK